MKRVEIDIQTGLTTEFEYSEWKLSTGEIVQIDEGNPIPEGAVIYTPEPEVIEIEKQLSPQEKLAAFLTLNPDVLELITK